MTRNLYRGVAFKSEVGSDRESALLGSTTSKGVSLSTRSLDGGRLWHAAIHVYVDGSGLGVSSMASDRSAYSAFLSAERRLMTLSPMAFEVYESLMPCRACSGRRVVTDDADLESTESMPSWIPCPKCVAEGTVAA